MRKRVVGFGFAPPVEWPSVRLRFRSHAHTMPSRPPEYLSLEHGQHYSVQWLVGLSGAASCGEPSLGGRQLESSLQDSIVAIDGQAIDTQPVASRRGIRKVENCTSSQSHISDRHPRNIDRT